MMDADGLVFLMFVAAVVFWILVGVAFMAAAMAFLAGLQLAAIFYREVNR